MSAKRTGFPVSEGLGVFVGVLGLEWLIKGYVEPWLATSLGIATVVLIMLYRRWQQRRMSD